MVLTPRSQMRFDAWMAALKPRSGWNAKTADRIQRCRDSGKRPKLRVAKVHFKESDFQLLPQGKLVLNQEAVPTRQAQMTRSARKLLHLNATPAQLRQKAAPPTGVIRCPCHAGDRCNDDIRKAGFVTTPVLESDRRRWARIIMPQGRLAEIEDFASKRRKVSKSHFGDSQLTGNGAVKPGELPTFKPPLPEQPDQVSPRSAEGRRITAEAARVTSRMAVARASGLDPDPDDVDLNALIAAVAEVIPHHFAPPAHLGANASTSFDQRSWLMSLMRENPAVCRYYTGEVTFSIVEATFEFIDCDGAFSTMVLQPSTNSATAEGSIRKSNAGAPAALSPFNQWVFWLVAFRRMRDVMPHHCRMFGISEATGYRYYAGWSCAVAHLSLCVMPEPTYEQYLSDTPAKTKELLGLEPGEAVEVGDATERFINDTKDRPMHSAIRSSYKQHETIKLNVRSTGSTYITGVDKWCPGAITDNKQHALFDVAGRQAAVVQAAKDRGVDGAKLAYNYDRGISDLDPFLQNGIRVVQAEKKRNKQMVFSAESAALSRDTAKSRIHIERGMREFKEYAGFGSVISMSQVDVADAEAECARFLVNLKPRLHNWTDLTYRSASGGCEASAPDLSGIVGDLMHL